MIFNWIFTLLDSHCSKSYFIQMFPSCSFYWLNIHASFSSNKGEKVKFKCGNGRICARREKDIDLSAVCFVFLWKLLGRCSWFDTWKPETSQLWGAELHFPWRAVASHHSGQEPMKTPPPVYTGSHFTISDSWNLQRRILMTTGRWHESFRERLSLNRWSFTQSLPRFIKRREAKES